MKFPILLPNIFNYPFTYESNLKLKLGDFVEVPFGKSKIIGVVWDSFEKSSPKKFKIKKIIRKLKVPSIKKKTIEFLNWFAVYNIVPKGMALKLLMLSGKAIEKFNKELYQDLDFQIKKNSFQLTKDQKNCLKEINISNQKFNVHVLQGTTGSGKTIVYFEALKNILEEKQMVSY